MLIMWLIIRTLGMSENIHSGNSPLLEEFVTAMYVHGIAVMNYSM